jgi:hypothetical protein
MELTKHIIIIEGHTGSGKTYLCRKLTTHERVAYITAQFMSSRQPESEEAVVASLMQDFTKLASALTCGYPVAVIDRCVLSQLVYEQLRDPAFVPEGRAARAALLLSAIIKELEWRTTSSVQKPTLQWVMLWPPYGVAKERRERNSVRGYPWPLREEREAYSRAWTSLKEHFDFRVPRSFTDPLGKRHNFVGKRTLPSDQSIEEFCELVWALADREGEEAW